MTIRAVDNWIDRYLEYHENTESAKQFHKWVAMSMIASVLRKKVHLSLGRIKVYPNMYVILVANPGIARKSQSIDFGIRFLSQIKGIHTSADSITREALLQDLEACAEKSPLPDGGEFRHASMSIISKEFESFLGHKTDNTRMLVLLTDLFDGSDAPWRYRTKQSGDSTVPAVFVNLLGATTPDSLAQQLPVSAIGGGLTSRILFIWASNKEKKIPIPTESLELLDLKEKLILDLDRISNLTGRFLFTKESKDFWIKWYNGYEELSPKRTCTDTSFDGWYSRKPMYILKVSQIISAAITSSLDIELAHLKRAIVEIESVELEMGRAFKAVGRSTITADVATVIDIVKSHNIIQEKKLLGIVWRDIDAQKFDNVVSTAIRSGKIRRDFNKDGRKVNNLLIKGTYYEYVGD